MRGLVREARLHLELLGRVWRAGHARDRAATRVQVHEVEGELLRRLARLFGCPAPVGGVEPREPGVLTVWPNVTADAVDLLKRHVKLIAVRIFQKEVVALLAGHLLAHDGCEVRDAMRGMDDVIARLEGEGDLRNVNAPRRTAAPARVHASVEVAYREHREMRLGHHHARRKRQVDEGHTTARERGHRHAVPAQPAGAGL